jgi:hypothetical protein
MTPFIPVLSESEKQVKYIHDQLGCSVGEVGFSDDTFPVKV